MSAAAKRRVDRATSKLTGKRCPIENTDESNAVEYVHCLLRLTKNQLVGLPHHGLMPTLINLLFQLDSLEFAWNISRFTLNVDTRANVIRRTFFRDSVFTSALVSSNFHKLSDSNHWLLPENSIINIYNNARRKKQEFRDIDVRTVLYFISWYIAYLTM